jgi:hypothetical protein
MIGWQKIPFLFTPFTLSERGPYFLSGSYEQEINVWVMTRGAIGRSLKGTSC